MISQIYTFKCPWRHPETRGEQHSSVYVHSLLCTVVSKVPFPSCRTSKSVDFDAMMHPS